MKMMSRLIIAVLGVGYYVGCSDVKFEKDYTVNPCQNSGQNCVIQNGREEYAINKTASGGVVDIVFMVDNSGSMSFEHTKMADRFSTFIQTLDNQAIDYRIGIITSHLTEREEYGVQDNSFPKDGELLTFANGAKFITQADANRETLFRQGVQRHETLKCEAWLRSNPNSSSTADYNANCAASGDESGIYALNRFLDRSSAIVRSNATLAIVILSDEDERSTMYNTNQSYKLASYDLPQNFLERARARFGAKAISVHSIVVNPGSMSGDATAAAEAIANGVYQPPVSTYDSRTMLNPQASSFFHPSSYQVSCLNSQYNQLGMPAGSRNIVNGSYGFQYALLSKMTDGIVGDICASSYGNQLADIGNNIVDRVSDIQLACANPEDLEVSITQNGVSYWVEGSLLKFSTTLNPGTKVTGKYFCQPL